jgi:hypothetical protein
MGGAIHCTNTARVCGCTHDSLHCDFTTPKVRVVPEVDLPGHATALLPLMSPAGVQFCTEYNASIGVLPSQVYDDEGGRSFHVIRTLLLEIFDCTLQLGSSVMRRCGCDLWSLASLYDSLLVSWLRYETVWV